MFEGMFEGMLEGMLEDNNQQLERTGEDTHSKSTRKNLPVVAVAVAAAAEIMYDSNTSLSEHGDSDPSLEPFDLLLELVAVHSLKSKSSTSRPRFAYFSRTIQNERESQIFEISADETFLHYFL